MPTTLNFTVTVDAPQASLTSWEVWYRHKPWEPGDPLYDPGDPDYGHSRSRPIMGVVDDHPMRECSIFDDVCAWMGADAWRWYPDKPATDQHGCPPPPGPPVTEFYGAGAS